MQNSFFCVLLQGRHRPCRKGTGAVSLPYVWLRRASSLRDPVSCLAAIGRGHEGLGNVTNGLLKVCAYGWAAW